MVSRFLYIFSRLYKVYGELSLLILKSVSRYHIIISCACSKIFFNITSNIYSLSSIRFVTLEAIFQELSSLELWIVLKKCYFSLTLLVYKASTSDFKYMFLIINHILCDKVCNSRSNISRIIPPWTSNFH
jgi:hypothetical protein